MSFMYQLMSREGGGVTQSVRAPSGQGGKKCQLKLEYKSNQYFMLNIKLKKSFFSCFILVYLIVHRSAGTLTTFTEFNKVNIYSLFDKK